MSEDRPPTQSNVRPSNANVREAERDREPRFVLPDFRRPVSFISKLGSHFEELLSTNASNN